MLRLFRSTHMLVSTSTTSLIGQGPVRPSAKKDREGCTFCMRFGPSTCPTPCYRCSPCTYVVARPFFLSCGVLEWQCEGVWCQKIQQADWETWKCSVGRIGLHWHCIGEKDAIQTSGYYGQCGSPTSELAADSSTQSAPLNSTGNPSF